MRRKTTFQSDGFTLSEMLVVMTMTSFIMGAAVSASVSLQKSMSAADKFFATHMQQIRIIDYLSRDVKRATAVTTSADRATVTCTVPNYVVASGDSEAAAAPSAEGTRRIPIVTVKSGGPQIDYGRNVVDGVTTKNSSTFSSANAFFTAADVGSAIWGVGIPDGTTITGRNSATTVTLSQNARLTASSVNVSWARSTTVVYALNNQTIERQENGAITTIASSTDQLVPDTTDVEQANTEFTASTVTFLPVFTFNSNGVGQTQTVKDREALKRRGTTVFAKAYLRNKRRG